jgi:hypothetical protein
LRTSVRTAFAGSTRHVQSVHSIVRLRRRAWLGTRGSHGQVRLLCLGHRLFQLDDGGVPLAHHGRQVVLGRLVVRVLRGQAHRSQHLDARKPPCAFIWAGVVRAG